MKLNRRQVAIDNKRPNLQDVITSQKWPCNWSKWI